MGDPAQSISTAADSQGPAALVPPTHRDPAELEEEVEAGQGLDQLRRAILPDELPMHGINLLAAARSPERENHSPRRPLSALSGAGASERASRVQAENDRIRLRIRDKQNRLRQLLDQARKEHADLSDFTESLPLSADGGSQAPTLPAASAAPSDMLRCELATPPRPTQLHQECSSSHEAFMAGRDECHGMLAELEELKRGREGAKREVQALRAEAGMLTESIERQRTEKAHAEQQLEQMKVEAEQLTESIERQRTEKAHAEQQLEQMKVEAEQLTGAAQRQEAAREQIEEELVKMKEEATQLTEFIKGLKAEKAQIEAQLDEQKAEAAQLGESIEGRNAERAQIDAQLAEMRAEAAQLAESIEGRNAVRAQIDAQLAESQAEAAQLGDSQTERGAEGSAAPAAEAAMAEQELLSGHSAEMAPPAAEPQGAPLQLEDLQRQLQGSQMELEETQRQLFELRETAQRDAETAANLQAAMGLRMQEQFEAHAAQLRAAEEKASSQLRAAEEKASSQLQEAAAAAADLQATADRLTSDCSDLQEERDRLRRELADITADRAARQREPAEDSRRIQELEGERQKLRNRLEEAEQRARKAESEKESADMQVRQIQGVQSETEGKLQAALTRAEALEERGRQPADGGEQPAHAEGHPETAQCRRDLLSLQARLDRVRDPDDKQQLNGHQQASDALHQRDETASDDGEDDDATALAATSPAPPPRPAPLLRSALVRRPGAAAPAAPPPPGTSPRAPTPPAGGAASSRASQTDVMSDRSSGSEAGEDWGALRKAAESAVGYARRATRRLDETKAELATFQERFTAARGYLNAVLQQLMWVCQRHRGVFRILMSLSSDCGTEAPAEVYGGDSAHAPSPVVRTAMRDILSEVELASRMCRASSTGGAPDTFDWAAYQKFFGELMHAAQEGQLRGGSLQLSAAPV